MERKTEDTGGRWEFHMPIRLHEGDVDSLLGYLKLKIQDQVRSSYPLQDPDQVVRQTKESETKDQEVHVKSITFHYYFGQSDYLGAFPFTLIAERKKGIDSYTLKMICRSGSEEMVQKKAILIRMLIVDWNAHRK